MSEPTPAATTAAALKSLPTGHWTLDPGASTVRLHHKTIWGLVTVKGAFTRISGEGETLPDGSAHGTLTIDATSLDTSQAKRDEHLRSADFFDSAQHPAITFTADRATPDAEGAVSIEGELTVRDTKHPVTFTARASDATANAVTLFAEVPFDRADYGLTWNKLGMITGPATITITARFTHA